MIIDDFDKRNKDRMNEGNKLFARIVIKLFWKIVEGNYYISKIQEEQLLVCQYYLYIERESEFLKY